MFEVRVDHTTGGDGDAELDAVKVTGKGSEILFRSDDRQIEFTGFEADDGSFCCDEPGEVGLIVRESAAVPGEQYAYRLRYKYDGRDFERTGTIKVLPSAGTSFPKKRPRGE